MKDLGLDLSAKMLVREAMSSPVISVDENEDIVQVANKMREQRVGAVIVVNENGNPVGIVTERDIVTRVVADGVDPNMLVASKVMTSPLKMVEPELGLMDAMKMKKKTDEQQERRAAALEETSKEATLVPLDVLEKCLEALELAKEVVLHGNKNSVSDA